MSFTSVCIHSSFYILINFHHHNNVKICFKMFQNYNFDTQCSYINSYAEGLNTLCSLVYHAIYSAVAYSLAFLAMANDIYSENENSSGIYIFLYNMTSYLFTCLIILVRVMLLVSEVKKAHFAHIEVIYIGITFTMVTRKDPNIA